MKWLVHYSRFYSVGKGDPASEDKVIGYSDLSEQELFITLINKYPDVPIRKKVKNEKYDFISDYMDVYNEKDLPYSDFVFFEENNLEEF